MGGDTHEANKPQEEEPQFGISMLPVCLQPRRIINRVYGLVGSRQNGGRTKQRGVVKAYFAPTVQSTQDDSDNCGISMKTDSKIESGDEASRPEVVADAPDQEVESKEVTGPHGADEEATSPSIPAADTSPQIRLVTQQPEHNERNQTMLGSFGILRPMEDIISTTPSAPPLPREEASGITSTSVQGSTRTFGGDIDRRNTFRTHRYFTATFTQRPPDRSGNLGIDYRRLQARKRRSLSAATTSGPRTRLGSVVGGYSATRFPSSTNRICPPPSRRTVWKSLHRDEPVDRSHADDPHVFNRPLSQIIQGSPIPMQTVSSQHQVPAAGGAARDASRDVPHPDTHRNNTTPPIPVQNLQTACRHVSVGVDGPQGMVRRNTLQGRRDTERSNVIQERVDTFRQNEFSKKSTEDPLKSIPVPHDESVGQFSRDVHGASIRLRNLELEVERLSKFEQLYESEVLCQICWENKRNALSLPCSHFQYCQECLEKHWQEKSVRECPLCRQVVSSILYIQIGK